MAENESAALAGARAQLRLAQLLAHVAPRTVSVAQAVSGGSSSAGTSRCSDNTGCGCAVPAVAAGTDGRESQHSQEGRESVVGPCGNAWHPVTTSANLRRAVATEVVFWGTSVCLWRGVSGAAFAIENRCAHRMLRLSKGSVDDDEVTCMYHGWGYAGNGELVRIRHEVPKSFKSTPDIKLRSYPLIERYGLIWLFFGDPSRAASTPLPAMPSLDSQDRPQYFTAESEAEAHFAHVLRATVAAWYVQFGAPGASLSSAAVSKALATMPAEHEAGQEGGVVLATFPVPSRAPLVSPLTATIRYDYPVLSLSVSPDAFVDHVIVLPLGPRNSRVFHIASWRRMEPVGIRLPYLLQLPLLIPSRSLVLQPSTRRRVRRSLADDKLLYHVASLRAADRSLFALMDAVQDRYWKQYVQEEQQRRASLRTLQWKRSFGAGLLQFEWARYK